MVQANSSVPSTLDGHPAYTIQWSNDTAAGTKTVSIINDNGYVIDYIAPKLDFPIYLPVIEGIIETFELERREPEIKGGLKELQKKGLKITHYEEHIPK